MENIAKKKHKSEINLEKGHFAVVLGSGMNLFSILSQYSMSWKIGREGGRRTPENKGVSAF